MPVTEMKSTGESDSIIESLARNAANLGIGEDEGESPPAPVEDEPAPSEPHVDLSHDADSEEPKE